MSKSKRNKAKRLTHTLTASDLQIHLAEQLAALRSSASSYDSGAEWEAKRLASTVRTLVHDTQTSKSLLGQLGIKTTLVMTDSHGRPRPDEIPGVMPWIVALRATSPPAPVNPKWVPILSISVADYFGRGFDDWWTRPIFEFSSGMTLSRKAFIHYAANQDGGSHVDPEIDQEWRNFSTAKTFLMSAGGEAPTNSPALAGVRTISWELLDSLERAGHAKG